jgi:hypothetical protein
LLLGSTTIDWIELGDNRVSNTCFTSLRSATIASTRLTNSFDSTKSAADLSEGEAEMVLRVR